MKKVMVITGMLLWTVSSFAQDIASSQVPSVILNSFKEKFPKATDVEWEMKGDLYNVEFDIVRADHEIWFDGTGKVIKHQEDISESELPGPVSAAIKRDFGKYRISDVEKIQSEGSTVYRLDLESGPEEWKMTFGEDGKVIEKIAD